jgi:hypothetical protein
VTLQHLPLSQHPQPVTVDVAREDKSPAIIPPAPFGKQMVAGMRLSTGIGTPAVQPAQREGRRVCYGFCNGFRVLV